MATRRKLEEEIARTKDPDIRKQLQELLDKRNQRRKENIDKTVEIINGIKEPLNDPGPPWLSQFLTVLIIICFGFLIVMFFLILSDMLSGGI